MTVTIILIIAVIALTAIFILYALRGSSIEKNLTAENNELKINLEKVRSELSTQLAIAQSKLQAATEQVEGLNNRIAALGNDLGMARESNSALSAKIEMMESEQAQEAEKRIQEAKIAEERFKNLANEILRQNTSDLKMQNRETLSEILNPLRENIEDFKKTVTDTYNNESRERFSLSERIKELVSLNQSISKQAKDLSDALRGDSKIQGDWGEMILESILEKSGLQKGEEYFTQVTTDEHGNTVRNEEGSLLRPDVVVKYPDGRFVVIDSKVSLTAFVEYSNAESDDERQAAATRHVRSVKSHVEELARKQYQDYVGGESKLDFVMMFIPNEPAYIAAMRLDPMLWQTAYDRHVLIVSPTHLVSGLKLIAQLWSRDRHTKNALAIAEEAGKMYDKFADFTKDMEKIDKSIGSVKKTYDDAMNKLSTGTGNLVNRAKKLRELGVKAKKQLAISDSSEAGEE